MYNRYSKATRIALVCGAALIVASPAVPQQGNSGPVARYTIEAGTASGMAAMGSGSGGGAFSFLSGGGGGQVMHELNLRLGSTREPTGAAKADHFMPQGAGLGKSVPLESPTRSREEPGRGGEPGTAELPRGRLLLYWGCAETAPKGQPVVIDFSKLARGQVPPGLYAAAVNLPEDWSITSANSRSYGEWPNSRDGKSVPSNASLLGPHRIASNYAPEIAFTLADDFMPALKATSRDLRSGAVELEWNALAGATGYYAWIMSANMDGGEQRDMVWWTSSATQAFGGPMSDYLSPAAARRLVEARTLMPPSQTTCAIPAEVKQAGGGVLMTTLYGYGPEADFAYPPRPADRTVPWTPEWIARARFRSRTMVMLGMPDFGGADFGDQEESAEVPPKPAGLPKCKGGLSGMAERLAGLCR